MKITIMGAGYVGAVTSACLAELGHEVVCTDSNDAVIESFQQGQAPFYEPGLDAVLKAQLANGRLQFSTDTQQAINHGEVIFLCVLTLPLPNGKPDLKPLQQTVKALTQGTRTYKLIVERTTQPFKTCEWLQQVLKSELPRDVSFDLAVVPHFMREGSAIEDFLHPDRIIIGSENPQVINRLTHLHNPITAPVVIMDTSSAELVKHASNAFLAMKISFINTIAHLCEKTGADIQKVSQGIGLDKRIAPDFLSAGLGYGGIFFSKDIHSLINSANQYHINLDLLKATEVINRYQRLHFVEKLEEAIGGRLEGKTIAIWGLAYRPDTDDMRDTPSLHIIRSLQNRGAKIRATDPLAIANARQTLPDVIYCDDPYETAQGAEAIAIVTEWPVYRHIQFDRLKRDSTCRVIVDGRNLYDPQQMKALGYCYVSIGRSSLDGRPVTVS